MKKLVFSLFLFLFVGVGYSQTDESVDVGQRKEYMIKTYKINKKKAEAYEQLRLQLQAENDNLKMEKISSSSFRSKQKQLYKKYGDKISQTFSQGRYHKWSSCTQNLEYYQVLCDTKLVPYEQMRALHKIEQKWESERKQLWDGSEEWAEKLKKDDLLYKNLNDGICRILGDKTGNWYIDYKRMYFASLNNMDRYKTTFKDAHAIAEIEESYFQKREAILHTKKKYAEKEVEMMKNDEKKEQEVFASVPADVANRWKKVNSAVMGYALQNRYGLSQSQTTRFKAEYSKYAIEEYKILNAKKLSAADRYARLDKLGDSFCQKVKPLFSTENYVKWQGWWKYDFERRMKRKGLM